MLRELEQKFQNYPYQSLNSDLPQAAVLIPLVRQDNSFHLILTRRASHMNTHSGEVAFPGGKKDEADTDLLSTALRESWEEISLEPGLVKIIGRGSSVVSRFGLEVTPFVGVIAQLPELRANTDELDRIFTVPLEFLLNPDNLQSDLWQMSEHTYRMPFFQYREYRIWGLTAIMLAECLNAGFGTNIPLDVPHFDREFGLRPRQRFKS
ncbi:DNA mismatch repair protein MutT [Endozoicomonas montiporae]|uniref:DNA mismatch repair protein MutT n=2 Tax=Endozoicomonas montiporae TaxID=1027273 RepID=A0A081NBI4_9GAMM|nr:CoA pyrophosphatase [Endozoicomonas montiporae]AMO56090.1 NUDIX hydrolase [Endozoicomonas montiporae CL-33]KEQ15807.1 DNA mismatch repair protein MutT [Endozoicomonas montiporae]